MKTGQGRAGFYSDSPLWDRCVDWYYRLLSREQPGRPATGYQVRASDRIVAAGSTRTPGTSLPTGLPAPPTTRSGRSSRAGFVLFTDTHLRYLENARPACETTPG